MSLVIVTHEHNLATKLSQILTHYFGKENEPNLLQIKTKYFCCDVPVQIISPEELQSIKDKIDFMIFLFNFESTFPNLSKFVDQSIQKHSPESQILVVNSAESTDQDWKYQDEVAGCENFVSVVYENLQKIEKERPQWKQEGLLSQHEEQFQIFSLFELIQTVIWTQRTTPNQGKKEQKAEKKEESNQKEEQIVQKKQDLDEEIDEQKLQKEMMDFELLMSQMMSMKDGSVKGNERKAKAEELILKLAANMDF